MDQGLIILILNILFSLFIVIGFLVGLKGIKKTGLSFVCFIVSVVISIFITPVVAKSIMQIKVTINGDLITLNDAVLSYVNSSPQIAEMTNASPAMKDLIQNIPLMVGNVFVFVLLSYVLAFLSWIIYLILASVFINKEEKIKDEKGNVIKLKSKKYRILGGVIGTFQGLILVFITFLPFSGLIGMVNDLTAQTAQASQQTQYQDSPSAQFIKSYIPEELQNVFDAYESSAIAKMSGFLNLDDACFDNVSTVTVDNIKISLRTEVLNIAKVYDNVEFLFNIDFSSLNALKALDYDKLNNAINYIFNSNILKATMPELVNYGFDKIFDMQEVKNNKDLCELLQSIQNELNSDDDVMNNLKTELTSILGSCKILVESKLFDEIYLNQSNFTNENLKNITDILNEDNKKVFNDLLDQLFNSKALNKSVIYVLNLGLENVETTLEQLTNNQDLNIDKIDLSNNETTLKKAEVKSLLSSVINLVLDFINVDFNAIQNDYRLIFELDLPDIATNLGFAMNAVQKMTVFNDTGIYDDIMTALSQTEYQKYIDFEILKNDNIWLTETKMLSGVLEKIHEAKIISYIDKNNDNEYFVSNENVTKILRNLTQKTEVNGQDKTLIRQIIEPLYNSSAFTKIIDFGFEQLNSIINNLSKKIDENVELGDINYEYIHENSEKENIFSFVDNVALYVQNLNIEDIFNDPFKTILNSNLVQLGSCMDFLKNSLLFADKNVDGTIVNGIYSNFVDVLLNTEFSKYVNFACFKDDKFSFNNEFSKITPIVDELLNKQIIDNNQSMPLIEYIISIGDDADGWKNIFEQINSEDLTNIFEPLMNSKIFEPIGVMVVNKINEQIKQVVGPYGDVITSIINSLDGEEISQVVDVLGAVSEIITEITAPDFTVEDMATGENADKLATLLDKLQDNANNDGVFKQSYDAMLEFMENDEKIGSYVTDLVNDYPQGQIDWQDLLSKIPKSEG